MKPLAADPIAYGRFPNKASGFKSRPHSLSKVLGITDRHGHGDLGFRGEIEHRSLKTPKNQGLEGIFTFPWDTPVFFITLFF
jgi:hypothetical protein